LGSSTAGSLGRGPHNAPYHRSMAKGATLGRAAALACLAIAACATESPGPISSTSASGGASPSRTEAKPTPFETPIPEGWTPVVIDGFAVREIVEGHGRIVAVGQSRAVATSSWIYTSQDGIAWTPTGFPGAEEAQKGGVETAVHGTTGFVATGGRTNLLTGIADPFILYSGDGLTWQEVAFPGPCAFGSLVLSGVWGYVIVAGSCHGEDEIDTRPIRVLRSPDGVNWTSTSGFPEFATEHHVPWWVATDGRRIVALQDERRAGDDVWRWISDDGGVTWRTIVETDLRLHYINYARERWFADANKDGIEVLCTSADAEEWACQPSVDGVPPAIATPTGFVSLSQHFQGGLPGSTYSVLATSTDGENWDVEMVLDLPNLLFHGEAATSVGVFGWGGTYPDQDPTGFSTPFLLLHRLPIP
jgi:hypothetical protein